MSMCRVMIEEQVVSGVEVAARLQERPYAIERRLPCSGDITEGDRGAGCRHKFRPRNLHEDIIFHWAGVLSHVLADHGWQYCHANIRAPTNPRAPQPAIIVAVWQWPDCAESGHSPLAPAAGNSVASASTCLPRVTLDPSRSKTFSRTPLRCDLAKAFAAPKEPAALPLAPRSYQPKSSCDPVNLYLFRRIYIVLLATLSPRPMSPVAAALPRFSCVLEEDS